MAYLSRRKRREQILSAVIDIASREGLANATVRRIAQELAIAPSQIHHLFASANALRAEALRMHWAEIEPEVNADLHRLPPRQRLLALLDCCPANEIPGSSPAIVLAEQLWKDAIWAMRMDEPVREAVAEGIQYWCKTVRDTLRQGIASGDFPAGVDVESALMTLQTAAFGFDFLQQIGSAGHQETGKAAFMRMLIDTHVMTAPAGLEAAPAR